jgi:hypothetical protein
LQYECWQILKALNTLPVATVAIIAKWTGLPENMVRGNIGHLHQYVELVGRLPTSHSGQGIFKLTDKGREIAQLRFAQLTRRCIF